MLNPGTYLQGRYEILEKSAQVECLLSIRQNAIP